MPTENPNLSLYQCFVKSGFIENSFLDIWYIIPSLCIIAYVTLSHLEYGIDYTENYTFISQRFYQSDFAEREQRKKIRRKCLIFESPEIERTQ